MAEAISRIKAADAFEAYSAGTEERDAINPDAVDMIKELYGVDMREMQKPKLLDVLPKVDVVVTMGCNVTCPYIPARYREDWGLEDPSGKGREAFLETARVIEEKVMQLKETMRSFNREV